MGRRSVTTKAASKADLAAEAWRSMLTFLWSQQGHVATTLRDVGLTPGHMKALFVLQPGEARPIGSLAETLCVEASMATWLVDRLEDRGYVKRGMLPADRRVRTITLTKRGAKTREDLLERLYEPPEALLGFDRETLEILKESFAELSPSDEPATVGTA